jgi:hypothetical protein
MHDEIGLVAAKLGLKWTFYIDDIALSGVRACEAIEPVMRIIQKHGHSAGRKKTRRMPNNKPQTLTGTLVNCKVSAEKDKRDALVYRIHELANKQEIAEHEVRSIQGKIAQIAWLNPLQGASLKRLAERYLPRVRVEGQKPRTDETRPCNSARRHRHERVLGTLREKPKLRQVRDFEGIRDKTAGSGERTEYSLVTTCSPLLTGAHKPSAR